MDIQHLTKTVHQALYPAIDPSKPSLSATGKTVIISGGASGVGLLTAQAFSIAGAARVVIIARRQEALDEAYAQLNFENATAGRKTEIWTYLLDIRDSSKAEETFSSIRARLNEGKKAREAVIDADILITSAASLETTKMCLEIDAETYKEFFDTNVVGNLNLVRAFLAPEIPSIPFFRQDGTAKDISSAPIITNKKTVLDVSSSAAYVVLPGQTPYMSSKLAFTRAMQLLNGEVDVIKGKPIRVHSYNPGIIYSPRSAIFMGEENAKLFPWDNPNLPGSFAVWLASPEAEFLRGRFVMSNWDVEELKELKEKYEADPKFGTITLKQ